jgi:penicillin-binding protein 1A
VLELGPQAAMVVLDPQTRTCSPRGRLRLPPGGSTARSARTASPVRRSSRSSTQAAIEARKITPATIINDSPEVYALWKPQNYEKEEFRGPVRVRTALAHSINTVAHQGAVRGGLPETKRRGGAHGHAPPRCRRSGPARWRSAR